MKTAMRALELCREYDQLSARITDLTQQIGNCLGQCMVVVNATADSPLNAKGYYTETHLAQALAPAVIDDGFHSPFTAWLDDDDKQQILELCPHCSMAYEHIKARKAAKKRLGAVKRSIRSIGRNQK